MEDDLHALIARNVRLSGEFVAPCLRVLLRTGLKHAVSVLWVSSLTAQCVERPGFARLHPLFECDRLLERWG